MKHIIIVIALILNCLPAISQPPSKFYTRFGGNGIDKGYGIKETYDRHYIISGSTTSYGYGTTDAILALVDSMGVKVWEKNYGGALTDIATRIIVNPTDSGYIFTGYTNSFGNGGYDIFVVRTNKDGGIIWQRSYGGIDWEFGKDIVLLPDGNLIICGNTYNSKYGDTDGTILKLDISDGTLLWQRYYGGSLADELNSVKLTTDNYLIFAGKTCSYNDSIGDIYFLKTDLNGDSVTMKTYGLKHKLDYANSILNDNIGFYLIGGGTESYSAGMKDAFLLKTDLVGDSIWLRNFGNPDVDEETYDIVNTYNYNGLYVFTYREIDFPFYKLDTKTIVVESNGFYMGGGTFGESGNEELLALANTSDKGFIGVGYTESYNAVLEDVFILKYDSLLQIAASNSVIGVFENHLDPLPLYIVYPSLLSTNSDVLTIYAKEEGECSIYSETGQLVYKGHIHEQNNSIPFGKFYSGIYFINIISGDHIYQKKVVKQ